MPGLLVRLQGARQVGGAGDGRTGGRAGGRLPGTGGHAGRAPLGYDHAVAAEGGDGADDGAEVARVGHAVEGDDQRVLALVVRGGREVLGVRVLVRRDLEDEALVVEAVRHAVELGTGGLHEVDAAALGGELERLAHPLVVVDELLDVQRGRGHALAQRLDDGVAADDEFGRCPCRRGPWARVRRCARACALALATRFFLWPLRISAGGVGPLPSRPRRRLPPLPTCAPFLPDMRRLFAAMTYLSVCRRNASSVVYVVVHRPCVYAVCRPDTAGRHNRSGEPDGALGRNQRGPRVQRGPCGLSSMTRPDWPSWSRMASAVAQSLRARAASRCSSTSVRGCRRPRADPRPGRSRRAHCGVQRVQAEDAEHGPDLGEPGHGGFLVVGGEGAVALPDSGVHDGEGLRDAQVVVHGLGEGGRHLGGGLDGPAGLLVIS